MAWLVCPEDDRLIEVDESSDAKSLAEMADHIFSTHASCDPRLVGPMLERVELLT